MEVWRYHLGAMSKTVAAAEFEAHPLELLEEVAETRVEVVVLKEGKPLAKLVPLIGRPRKTLEEMRAAGVKILGDIEEPLAEWDLMLEPRKTLTLEELRSLGGRILGAIVEPPEET